MKVVGIPLIVAQWILASFSEQLPDAYIEPGVDIQNPSPEWQASFLSTITFWWLNPLILIGYRKPLKQDYLYDLSSDKKTAVAFDAFSRHWTPLVTKSIILPTFKAYLPNILLVALLKFVASLLMFVPPIVLDNLLVWMVSREPMWRGIFFVVVMFASSCTESILNNQYEYNLSIVAMKMRSAVTKAIYEKALRMSPDAKNKFTTGQITNFMSVDAQRIIEFMLFSNTCWSSPLQISIAVYLLWQQLGVATIAGVMVMIFLIPLNGYITSIWRKSQGQLMKKKDSRSKLINEVLAGMKVIKLYGWEPSFTEHIKDVRGKEVVELRRQSWFMAMVTFSLSSAPIFVALVSFVTYTMIDEKNVLDASKAFVSLSLFNLIRLPLTFLPLFITFGTMYFVAMKRINEYLNCEESDFGMVTYGKDPEGNAITVKDGTFRWSKNETSEIVLRNINLNIPQNKLIAVVGTVGSGKSSLLSALLGDMYKVTGSINISGSLAYVPQVAWIQNATMKQNIIFTSSYDQQKYQKVIEATALQSDIEILAAGDLTEIGEKGINLSGGQKQRVSLARAVYSDSDIFLLDDPLSAVDSHVGKHIFDHVIGPKGLLQSKTRVLVTHRISLLPSVDWIVVMKDGKVSESGTYHELLAQKGAFADFLVEYFVGARDEDIMHDDDNAVIQEVKNKLAPEIQRHLSIISSQDSSHKSQELKSSLPKGENILTASNGSLTSPRKRHPSRKSLTASAHQKSVRDTPDKSVAKGKPQGRLTETEKEQIGGVTWAVYLDYFRAVGWLSIFLILAGTTVSNGFNIGSSLWLSAWSADANFPDRANDTGLRDLRLGVYAGLGLSEAAFLFVSNLFIFLGTLRAGSILHNVMLDHLMRAPMSFFDTTPTGRILNRFTKDIDALDTSMRMNIRQFISSLFKTFVTFIIISLETPFFLVAVAPLAVVYYVIQRFYIRSSRQLKRIEGNTRSPIYSHFSETVTGTTCIRAFNANQAFCQELESRNDANSRSYLLSNAASRWLAVRLEFVGNIIVLMAASFAVSSTSIDPALAGLSISYALTITGTLNMLVRGSADLENNLVSVERVIEYTKFALEAAWYNEATKPKKSWPDQGLVKFDKYSTRYRPGLDLVLKELSFETNAAEKIGIVGRTGAGKSSLTLALFRLIEPASGTIIIDGVDVSRLGLMDLRSKLTIIPQDPILFTGTLRMNLDPFNSFNDQEIWTALEQAHLKDFVQSVEGQTQYKINEGGENLSVGQRQLVCLARALLRKSKILILDEATAAVDLETDDLIQKTIRSQFKDCTIITIAHRLNTVLDYDRILLMDKGEVAEFDTPTNLLANTGSKFYAMAKDAGLVHDAEGASNDTGNDGASEEGRGQGGDQ